MPVRQTLVAAVAFASLVALSAPSHAATAFQQWAQGRGAYVPSKERLSTWEDDIGWAPPRRVYRREAPRYYDYGYEAPYEDGIE